MNLVFRIVFGIVVILVFVSITYSTFFIPKQYSSLPALSTESSQNLGASGALYFTSLSKYESLYTSFDTSQEINSDSSNISVHREGRYLSSYRNIGTVHDFTGTGFIISQKGIGEMYIDTVSKKGKVFVYAKNTPAEVILTSDDGSEEYTTVYLAPGMYLEFRTGIGKNLNNADRLRISTVNKLGYISLDSESSLGPSLEVYFSNEDSIFNDAIEHIGKIDRKKSAFLTSILEGDISEISGYNYIERYLHLFVNDEKKKIFYKNMLLEGYLNVLRSKKIDDSLLTQIKKDESILRNLDEASYDEMVSLRGNITSTLNSMQSAEYIPSKILFSRLQNPSLVEKKWIYPMYSFALFSGNMGEKQISQQLTKNFFDSFALYMEETENSQDTYDYFLYFLEQRLLYLLSGDIDEQSIGSTLEVLSTYYSISQQAKYTEKNQKITQIYSITQIMQSIDSFLRNTYFNPERDSNNLLVLRNNISLGGSRLGKMQGLIEGLFTIYKNNNSLLNSISARDKIIIENITESKNNIDEYIAAMGNYETYKEKYDISKNTILNVDVITNGEFELSEQNGREYLSQFIGIAQDSYTLTVVDDQYYSVKNLILGGRKFDFEIYPYSSSRLRNIVIDDELQSTEYTLDNIQDDWEEKYETAAEEFKEQYDFSRFFIVTFLTQQQREVVNFEIEYTQEESKAEIVFKRDILLGDKGEFAGVRNFLNIDYADISLVQEGNSYDIFLDNVDYSLKNIAGENINSVSGILKSQYILNSNDHSFKNVGVTVESDRRGPNNSVLYEFGGTHISLVGNIYIDTLDDSLREMFIDLESYFSIYSNISSGTNISNLVIEYTPTSKKTRFKFDSGEKSFTIILQDSEVSGIYEGTTKIASSPIKIQDINSYIQ